jgi:TolB protein
MKKKSALIACIFAATALLAVRPASAQQDWFKTGTGLGVAKARVATPDFAAPSSAAPLETTFHNVLWNDLEYSGILDMVSQSFYPLQTPSKPSDLTAPDAQGKPSAQDWASAPANTYMLAYGSMEQNGTNLSVSGFLSAVQSPSAPPALQKIYTGPATDEGARQLAHQFADDIISLLGGGLPGIAQTQIAYVSSRGGSKEIWAMDYDGANAHQLTHLKSIALTPRWSPDATKIAFTCYEPYHGVLSAQVCIYSMDSNHLISFPRFPGTNGMPAWSPDGSQLAFMSGLGGGEEIYTANADGGHLQKITDSVGVNTSPVWNPKTGQQIVFVSGRDADDHPELYISNSDGSNVQKIDLPDMGYVVDPAWSPNGQLLAFSWQRPDGNYDIYVMDIVTHQLAQLTRDTRQNERPSWAPDGRHIVFESTRTGSDQIWSMLADGSMPRQLTFQGVNSSPNWSPR